MPHKKKGKKMNDLVVNKNLNENKNLMEITKLNIESFKNAFNLAQSLAKSQLVKPALRNKPADIALVLMMGYEMNLSPMMSLKFIDVINGQTEISAQGKLAIIRRNFPNSFVKIEESEDSCTCTMARDKNNMREAVTVTFSKHDAKLMGLLTKDNYVKQAKTMFTWRAVSKCARIVFPDYHLGSYTEDEIQDIPKESEVIDLGEAEVTSPTLSKLKNKSNNIEEVEPSEPSEPSEPVEPVETAKNEKISNLAQNVVLPRKVLKKKDKEENLSDILERIKPTE
jgi:hypothetical protein